MAAILAVATMKEQLKLNNTSSTEIKPCITITPSRLSPNLNTENSNNSNSGTWKFYLTRNFYFCAYIKIF